MHLKRTALTDLFSMDYTTSLLIYKTQTLNVNSIWKSKIRLIKNTTPLFRNLTESDILLNEKYKSEYQIYVNSIISQLNNLSILVHNEPIDTKKDELKQQISQLKIDYSDKRSSIYNNNINDKILEIESTTRLLILIYCTWTEASFIKLKHTPHGLNLSDREKSYGSNISDKWNNLIDHILSLIPQASNIEDISQMRNELKAIADEYIIEPSKIRNKIAHGQWLEAMNTNNTKLVLETSLKISKLDLIKIDVSFDIQNYFVQILESILESNSKIDMITGRDDSYLFLKNKLDNFIISRKEWNLKSRTKFLQQRPANGRILEIAKKLKLKNIDSDIIKEVTGITLE